MLKGKTALVTGASRGIGRAIALEFAQNGADIAIVYAGNTEKAEETKRDCESFGVKAGAYRCDVSDYNEVKATVAAIKTDLAAPDILVNNAGITRDGLIPVMSEDAFDAVIATNLKGAFNLIKSCCPFFIRAKAGKIINISSVSGLTGNAGQTNYSAAKAGLIGLTKSAARELASRGITCNAIAPGFIETDMTKSIDNTEKIIGTIPMGRFGSAEEVAKTALFLASAAADYITGEVIRVDGGMAM